MCLTINAMETVYFLFPLFPFEIALAFRFFYLNYSLFLSSESNYIVVLFLFEILNKKIKNSVLYKIKRLT
jgi:hypothetical protein